MEKYVSELKTLFEQNTIIENIEPMQDYMRGKFEFLGIKTPLRRELSKQFVKQHGYPEISEIPEFIQLLWDEPYRELHHVGMDVLLRFAKKMPEDSIELYEYLITNHSWWDTVDMLATKGVGSHLKRFPHLIPSVNQYFLKHENMWLNRTALLFQLKYKKDTDVNLLSYNIDYLKHRKEFFIQKAIGWVLREYSRTNPDFVQNFVANHELAALSKKEALRLINKKSSK